MGNVKVQYRHRRGIFEAGSEIEDPKDFFESLVCDNYTTTKAFYDQLTPEKKQSFRDIFKGELDIGNQTSAGIWFNESVADEEGEQERAVVKQ